MKLARAVLASVLCALACESSPAARTLGGASSTVPNRDSIYRVYLHQRVLEQRADTIADRDPRTLAAWNDFLQTMPPEMQAWWDSLRTHPHAPMGIAFGDSATARAHRRYGYVRGTVWASAVDSQVWAERPQKWWVAIAVVVTTSFPAAGRLYRLPDQRHHDVIVLRRDALTSERILTALRFTRANWLIDGLTPSSLSAVDIGPVSDTTVGAGAGPITAAWVIDQLANTHGASVVLDSLGVLPATSVALPLPRAVRLKGPA
jgi:hypothetical protein